MGSCSVVVAIVGSRIPVASLHAQAGQLAPWSKAFAIRCEVDAVSSIRPSSDLTVVTISELGDLARFVGSAVSM
jgi:hypothetical protein